MNRSEARLLSGQERHEVGSIGAVATCTCFRLLSTPIRQVFVPPRRRRRQLVIWRGHRSQRRSPFVFNQGGVDGVVKIVHFLSVLCSISERAMGEITHSLNPLAPCSTT